MNKKVLSAILFSALFAGSGTFTSCIDTDEPAGIEDLRTAKAALILAKAEVEKANYEYRMAETQLKQAEAAVKMADAAYREAEARKKEAEAAIKEAESEEREAYYQKLIDGYKKEMEVAAETHKVALAQQKALAAQQEYALSVALKQIEIAKAIGSETEKVALKDLEVAVKEAYDKLYGAKTGGKSLAERVYDAQEALYNAQLDAAEGLGDGVGKTQKYIPELKQAVKTQEATVAAEKEKVVLLNEFLSKDVETTDWRAEVETLSDSIEALKLAADAKNIEVEKALNSEDYLAAAQKVYGVYENGEDAKKAYLAGKDAIKNGTKQDLKDATEAHDKYAKEKKLTLSKIELKPNAQLVDVIDQAVKDYNAEAEVDVKKWDKAAGKYFIDKIEKAYHPEYDADGEAETVADETLAELNAFIGALGVAEIDEEELKWAEQQKEDKEEAVADAEEAYEAALASWNIAKLAMEGTATDIPATEVAKVTTAITAYNTAVATLAAKVEAYNTTHDEVYQAAYDAEVAKYYNEFYWGEFSAAAKISLPNAPFSLTNAADIITSIETLNTASDATKNYEAMCTALEAYYVAKDPSVADNVTKAAEQKAKDKKAAKDATEIEKINQDGWASFGKTAGNKAINDAKAKDKALYTASANVDAAVKALYEVKGGKTIGAHKAMTDAFDAYKTLAADEYAQVPTEAAAKIALPAAPAKWAEDKDADANGFVYKKSNAVAMDETKVAAMMELELDEALAETALLNTSNKAFGIGGTKGRLTMPTDEEILEGALNKDADKKNDGAKYTLIKANEALTVLNDQLAQQENLTKFIAEATTAKTALVAEIAANDKLFDTYHAAIEAAEEADEKAVEELDAITVTLVGELNVELAQLKAKQYATEAVLGSLQSAIFNHLHIEGWTSTKYTDAESFIEDLEEAVALAESAVIEAEKALAQAKIALQKAEDGQFDAVSLAQFKLDVLMIEYNAALAEYNRAYANLQKYFEIMSESAE